MTFNYRFNIAHSKGFTAVNSQGFTLIEILISMALLAVISLSIYQAVTQTFRLRDKLMTEGDFYNGTRLALALMERDISLMYSPIIMNPNPNAKKKSPGTEDPYTIQVSNNPDNADAELQAITTSEIGQVTDHWLGASDKTGIRPSRFVGTDEKLSFISAGYVRLYKGKAESDFAKVHYELKPDLSEDAMPSTKVLYKVEDPNVFDDATKKKDSEKIYPILYGITQFKIRYYRKDKKSWVPAWDNSKEDQRFLYPDLIEVKIQVKGPKNLSFDGISVFKPEILYNGLPQTF